MGSKNLRCHNLGSRLFLVQLVHSLILSSFTMASNAIKKMVSKKKRRFEGEGFNLDLSYVTDQVIAMGYPSQRVESVYRNSLEDVRRFLEARHSGHYKVYNLCSERCYDIRKFHSRVAVYPFDDHSPPEFALLRPFCEDVTKWLKEDPRNVAAVHCKAGKGRTGLMICAFLLFSGRFSSARDVLDHYASKRTFDSKGVTLPSQRRYVAYFAAKLELGLEYSPARLLLTAVVLRPPPTFGFCQQEAHLQLQVHQTLLPHFDSDVFTVDPSKEITLKLPNPLLLKGDVKLALLQKVNVDMLHLGSKPKFVNHTKICHFWVNTCFAALGHSCPLSHTVLPSTDGKSSQVMIPTANRFSALEVRSPLPPPRRRPSTRSQGDVQGNSSPDLKLLLGKSQIDKAAGDASGRFAKDFTVELQMNWCFQEAWAPRLKPAR